MDCFFNLLIVKTFGYLCFLISGGDLVVLVPGSGVLDLG